MKYDLHSRVRFSETDENGRLSLSGLMNYFQDCSTFQAEDLGIGVDYHKEHANAWILIYWQVILHHMPKLGEHITATTWPYYFKGFHGLRNFTLTDSRGEMAAWANSFWILLDVNRQRPVKIPDEELQLYGGDEKLDMDYAPRRVRLPKEALLREAEPIRVTPQHLDTNHHVNNGQYVQMAMHSLADGRTPREIRTEYRMQARLGDVIVPGIFEENDSVYVSLHDADGKPYAIVQLLF